MKPDYSIRVLHHLDEMKQLQDCANQVWGPGTGEIEDVLSPGETSVIHPDAVEAPGGAGIVYDRNPPRIRNQVKQRLPLRRHGGGIFEPVGLTRHRIPGNHRKAIGLPNLVLPIRRVL